MKITALIALTLLSLGANAHQIVNYKGHSTIDEAECSVEILHHGKEVRAIMVNSTLRTEAILVCKDEIGDENSVFLEPNQELGLSEELLKEATVEDDGDNVLITDHDQIDQFEIHSKIQVVRKNGSVDAVYIEATTVGCTQSTMTCVDLVKK